MLGELVPCGGGDPICLLKKKIIVGRDPDCDIALPIGSISSRHCELEYVDGYWNINDLFSRNGTTVNGIRYQKTRIEPYDIVAFARQRYSILYDVNAASDNSSLLSSSAELEQSARNVPGDVTDIPQSQLGSLPISPTLLGRMVPCGGGDPIQLMKTELIIGRKNRCDIQLRFSTVSSQHCKLEFKDGYWFAEDLKSRNGMKIDNVLCHSGWVMPESILSISKHRYQFFYSPTSDGPPPEENPFSQSLLEKAGLSEQLDRSSIPRWNEQGSDEEMRQKKWTLDEDDTQAE